LRLAAQRGPRASDPLPALGILVADCEGQRIENVTRLLEALGIEGIVGGPSRAKDLEAFV
jgi:hypothetical protein